MMIEPAQIAGFCQDGQRVDRADARNLAQQLVVDMLGQSGMGKPLYLVTLLDEASPLRDAHAKHGDCCRILRDRQSDGGAGRFVYVVDETGLGNLTADERPGRGGECLGLERDDAGRSREPLDERKEPVGPAVAGETGDLGKVERQIVGGLTRCPGYALRLT